MTSQNRSCTYLNILLHITILLSAIYAIKGIIYAVYIIPPAMGTSPDDMGHMSYVKFIADNKSLPTLFVSPMDKAIHQSFSETERGNWKDFPLNLSFQPDTLLNWIAQHPPLYYLLLVPIYKLATIFTTDLSSVLITLRLFTLTFGILTIFYLYKLLIITKVKLWISCSILFTFVFNLSIQWCFFNVTNDSLLILLSTSSLYYLLNYTVTNSTKDYYLFVILSALVVLTKYTGIVLLVPFFCFFSYKEITTNGFKAFLRKIFSGIVIVSVLIIPLLIRNYMFSGDLFPVAHSIIQKNRADITIFQFLTQVQYFDDLYWNICGLLGWTTFTRANIFVKMFVAIFVFISGIISLSNVREKKKKIIITLLGIAALIIQYKIFNFFFSTALAMTGILILTSSNISYINTDNHKEYIILFIATAIFYLIILFVQQYNLYLLFGHLRATHGRYYYILFFPICYLIFNQFSKFSPIKTKALSVIYLLLLIILELSFVKDLFSGTLLIS